MWHGELSRTLIVDGKFLLLADLSPQITFIRYLLSAVICKNLNPFLKFRGSDSRIRIIKEKKTLFSLF
jgi:hypothetical protein